MEEDKTKEKSIASTKKINWKVLIFILTAFMIGTILGFFVQGGKKAAQYSPLTTKPEIVKNEDPRQLLDPIEILKSPLFTEWMGTVEGNVVAKTTNSFTVEKSGRQLEIFTQQSLTGFYNEQKDPRTPLEKIEFNQLQIGQTVRGGVTLSRQTLDNNPEHHVFANVFTILNNAQK